MSRSVAPVGSFSQYGPLSGFIAQAINQENNWGKACAFGTILLIATLILYFVYNRLIGIDRMKFG